MSAAPPPVRRRLVCVIPGFDPRGPASYHALMSQAAQQAARGLGWTVQTSGRHNDSPLFARWTLSAQAAADRSAADGAASDTTAAAGASSPAAEPTTVLLARWDDVVRAHWTRGLPALLRGTLAATARQWASGALPRMAQRAWPAGLALLSPGLLLGAGGALAGLLLMLAVGLAVTGAWGAFAWTLGAASLACVAGWQAWRRWHMDWLARSLIFTGEQARGLGDLQARIQAWADALAPALRDADIDEVLLAGHSTGSQLAVQLAAALLQAGLPPQRRLSLLTLGQCIPLLAEQPAGQAGADALRQALHTVARHPAVDWIDLSHPADGCCFALCDPLAEGGDGEHEGAGDPTPRRGPRLHSTRLHALLPTAAYRALRRDRFALHFAYFGATPEPGPGDWTRLCAGQRPLAAQFDPQTAVRDYRVPGWPGRVMNVLLSAWR